MGNVRLYGSTSGYTELAPPAVAPDGVLSLPSGVGTLLTAEGGKVLQVVRATDSTIRSTTSASFVDASISVTITPQRNTSAIFLLWSARLNVAASVSTTNFRCQTQITDNSNVPISGAEQTTFGYYSDATALNSSDLYYHQSLFAYDTPATTSPLTYKGRFRVLTGSTTISLGNINNTGQLFAIEVSA